MLGGCAATPPTPTGPAAPPAPTDTGSATSRWVAADWAELPGFADDRLLQAWPAWQQGCSRPPAGWAELCARVLLAPPGNEASAQAWLREHLRPYRIESSRQGREGLVTGYFEPEFDAARRADARFIAALHAAPPDLAQRRPYWTREQLDTVPAAQAALRGREIAFIEDPLDVLLLQIQGSGRLRVAEPDGSVRTVRMAFAGHNGQPFRSPGRWLVAQGALKPGAASWPAIKAWALQNPERMNDLLWSNPRVVFFREEALPDPARGPRGALGVPLTPGRSIAVDPRHIPLGTPLWLDSTEPLANRPLRRLVLAQDTGGAIVGAVRADFFWGWGAQAQAQAARTHHSLRLWALWPNGMAPPR